MSKKIGSEKETTAVTFNIKEQRCLEKSLQTLTLERSYQLKLLDLDHRIIKVSYKRLKDKVSKIKSYLNTDDISELKQLETDGKLSPSYTSVNLSSALQIAAAARRLKLQSGNKRSKSAVPFRTTQNGRENGRLLNARPHTAAAVHPRRCNSVTGVFIDAPDTAGLNRRGSLDENINIRPPSVTAFKENVNETNRSRSAASFGTEMERLNSGKAQRGSSATPNHTMYDSHSAPEKDSRLGMAPPAPTGIRARDKSPYLSDDSIDSNLGDDLYEERRQELLEEEHEKTAELVEKKNDFLKRVETYLRENPQPAWGDNAEQIIQSKQMEMAQNSGETKAREGSAKHKRRRKFQGRKVDFQRGSAEDFEKRSAELWKDMSKCRYLRVPDEKIDLSGVNTLAVNQMKLFQMLRSSEGESFLSSVQI